MKHQLRFSRARIFAAPLAAFAALALLAPFAFASCSGGSSAAGHIAREIIRSAICAGGSGRIINNVCTSCDGTWDDTTTPSTCVAPPPPTCTSAQRLINNTCMDCAAPNMWNDDVNPPTCDAPPPPMPGVSPSTGVRGHGVNIAINDNGIDAGHADFADSDGSGSRIQNAGAQFLYSANMPNETGSFRRLNNNLEMFVVAGRESLFTAFTALPRASRCTGLITTNLQLQDCARAIIESIGEVRAATGISQEVFDELEIVLRAQTTDGPAFFRLPRISEMHHGTSVASIAAGNTIGVESSNANIVPVHLRLRRPDDPPPTTPVLSDFLNAVDQGGFTARNWAEGGFYHVVNHSFGAASADIAQFELDFANAVRAADAGTRRHTFWQNTSQGGVAEAQKVVRVWASGNNNQAQPEGDPGFPRHFPELRDHWITVAATGGDGIIGTADDAIIAGYSNRCGPRAAADATWDEALHGRHFCITALGDGSGAAAADGRERVSGAGTSFAAPRVTGAIAAVMRNARGSVSAVEALRRIKRTANNSGRYADAAIYGAGLLDLTAALNTFGNAQMGTATGLQAPVLGSTLALPSAHGAAVARGLQGVEIAAFDALNFPFWYAASDFVHTQIQPTLPLWARMDSAPNEQNDLLQHLQWNSAKQNGGINYLQPRMTLAQDTLGFSLAPFGDAGAVNKTLLRNLRFGMLFEGKTHHGARPAGAFGAGVSSQMLFVSGEQNFNLGAESNSPWQLQTRLLFGAGKPDYQRGAMFRAGASVYSSGALALQHRRGDVLTQLGVAQPLRAESGRGVLHYAGGRALSGARLYERHEFSLAPKPRALRVTLRHERPVNLARWFGPFGEGLFALELLHAHNRGHIRGAQETRLDAALNLNW